MTLFPPRIFKCLPETVLLEGLELLNESLINVLCIRAGLVKYFSCLGTNTKAKPL